MQVFLLISGIIQIILCVIAFFFKQKKQFLICNITYNTILTIQYLVQGYFTELYIVLIDVIRTLIFFGFDIKNKKPNIYIIILFEIVYLSIGILTFENWFSIFAILCSLLSTFAQWQSNMLVLRISYIICSTLIIINFIFTGLYTTIIAEAIAMGSAIISILKYYVFNKNSKVKLIIENGAE